MQDLQTKIAGALLSAGWQNPKVEVLPLGRGKFEASVVSPSFEGVDKVERQAQIWDVLSEELDEYEHSRVEFVFVFTPAEMEKLSA